MPSFSRARAGILALSLPLLAACGSDASGPSPATPAAGDAGAPSSGVDAGDTGAPTSGDASSDGAAAPTGPVTTVTYSPDTATVVANPERGFYHHTETTSGSYEPLDAPTLASYRTEAITHVLRVFYLEDFVASDISAEYLAKMAADFAAARQAGVKVIVRFAYTADEAGNDAAPARVLAHIAQLRPALRDNADVIEAAQGGFVGAWGEGYYTTSFGNAGNVSAADWANRKSVVDALLDALPSDRMVQLRTPAMKRTMYGPDALTSAEAFTGAARARVGHHDDVFVADADDMGTYADPAVEVPYVAADSLYVPVGGENDAYDSTRTACPSATAEMEKLHWSFLNTDYLETTIASWKQQGCYETMRRNLGYRLSLVSGTYSTTVAVGGAMVVKLVIRNDGYAALFNPRPVEIVARETASHAVKRFALAVDPRRWGAGATSAVDATMPLAGLPAGDYDLFLALPDAAPALHDRAEYAVRLANADTWNAELAANDLKTHLTIR